MKLRMFQVDAFTERLFGGNPAAVVLLEDQLADETLQAIAAENNLSETAFVHRCGEQWALRWFTPAVEVDLCGHATLATAYVLFREGLNERESLSFQTASGELVVRREEDRLCMDFPSRPPEPIAPPSGLAAALGCAPVETHQSRDLLALFDREEQVAALTPDFVALTEVAPFAVIATAPGQEVDFVSRFFAPRVGIPEDPVTGSAHCTLTPFWAGRLGKSVLRARQISSRQGELTCRLAQDRVELIGQAVLFLEGEIAL